MTESEGSQEHYLFENLLHNDTFIRHMYLYLKLSYRSCTFLSVLQIGPHANIMTKPSNQSSNYINGITSTLTPYASSKHHVKNLHSKHISTILSKYVWISSIKHIINVLSKYETKASCIDCLFGCISINKYMTNKDKIYIVFVGRRLGVHTTWPECQVQVIGYKGNVYKSYRTHHKVVSAWVIYEPWWKKLDAPIESPKPIECN